MVPGKHPDGLGITWKFLDKQGRFGYFLAIHLLSPKLSLLKHDREKYVPYLEASTIRKSQSIAKEAAWHGPSSTGFGGRCVFIAQSVRLFATPCTII